MEQHASGGYETQDWDEKPYDEQQGGLKFTRVSASNTYHGDLTATSHVEYLMVYPDEDHCSFTGLERVTGKLGGREGSFVLQQSGTFEAGTIHADWFVVPGSATGELSGLRGQGGFDWDGEHGKPTPYTLAYDFVE